MASEYQKFTVARLKTLLKERELDTSGVKKDLIKRLEEYDAEAEAEVDEEEEVEDEEAEDEGESDEEVGEDEEAEVEEDEEVEETDESESQEGDDQSESVEPPKPRKIIPRKPAKKTEKTKKVSPPSKEGIFGTLDRVNEILCENRDVLDIFRLHTKSNSLEKLISEVFEASSMDSAKTSLTTYIAPLKGCEPGSVLKKNYRLWLNQIVDDLLSSLIIPSGDIEPKFDADLGIYRIGSYAFQMDPKTMSTALVFAYISSGKIVPLSSKTLRECPKEYTLWHEYHSSRSPPNEKEIKKIIDQTPFPREKETGIIDIVEDGVSFPRKSKSAPEDVESDLAAITTPKPDRKTFNAYRKSQRHLKTANYLSIAKDAGISEDDARYIAQHFNEMSVRYAK